MAVAVALALVAGMVATGAVAEVGIGAGAGDCAADVLAGTGALGVTLAAILISVSVLATRVNGLLESG